MGMDASQFLLSDICMQSGWWFQTWILFSMSYMGCHPSHWRTPSFFKMVIAPPIRYWLIHLGMVYFIYTIINHYKPLLTTIKPLVLLKQSSSMEAPSIPKIQLDGNHWTGLKPTWHMNLWGLGGTVPLQTSGIWL